MRNLLNIYQPYRNENHSWIGNYVDNPEEADVIVFSGGSDVNPSLYGQSMGRFTGINPQRDTLEVNVYNKWKDKKAFIGVCRGAQLLTVLAGGELIQHVNNHGLHDTHQIKTQDGSVYEITSTHHQMCFPYNMDGKYEVIAYAEHLADVHLNGNNVNIIEAKSDDYIFQEPEIIFYEDINALAIQGHPEYNHCPQETVNYCLNLIEQKLKIEVNA